MTAGMLDSWRALHQPAGGTLLLFHPVISRDYSSHRPGKLSMIIGFCLHSTVRRGIVRVSGPVYTYICMYQVGRLIVPCCRSLHRA